MTGLDNTYGERLAELEKRCRVLWEVSLSLSVALSMLTNKVEALEALTTPRSTICES
ncbi:hypothetical protein LCGC14_0712800 [marine sediment metagenome]|uniref:Uncharacterized protein n=1 Tax=marine sediment metagenome TaxID=412755 RepID=A0A0F9QEJ1_9ZZZZ